MTEANVLDEALRLVRLGDARGIPVRLLGGLAVAALVPAWQASADRPGRDIDIATDRRSRRPITELLESEGYVADRGFNVANGHKQLYFVDAERGRPVDVIIDQLEMCHTFTFGDGLRAEGVTLPPAMLLLSKLQVVKINRKDLLDALVLLAEFPLGDGGAETIAVPRILAETSSDWGWWRTVTGNLDRLTAFVEDGEDATGLGLGRPPRFPVLEQIVTLRARIDAAPKSLSWKVRARVGDRMPWYELPEEVAHD